jgi:SAM-dependent methyltransferase
MPLSRQYATVCDARDFQAPDLRRRIREIVPGADPVERIERKHWEFAMLTLFLEEVGAVTPDKDALAVGAGRELVLYWMADRMRRVVATDIYGQGSFAAGEAEASMLADARAHAPYPFREEALEVRWMDARELAYPDDSFDVVFSLSSIEHFGSPGDVRRAAREMGRVLRPGGYAVVVTECFLNRHPMTSPLVHFAIRMATLGGRAGNATPRRRAIEAFTPRELQRRIVEPSRLELVQPLELRRPSPETRANPIRFVGHGELDESANSWPHVLITAFGTEWTSVFLPLAKPG